MAQLNCTVVIYNISSTPGYSPHPTPVASSLVPSLVLSMCFLLGFSGNIAVIILKPNWENMLSLSQSVMLSLAGSDLLLLVTLPLWIYSFLSRWIFGLVSCNLITYFVYWSIYASLLTVLSVQHYLHVVHLQRSLHQLRARNIAGALTFVNSALNPLLYAFTSNHFSTVCQKINEHLMQKFRIP